jgi:hypothetical protein
VPEPDLDAAKQTLLVELREHSLVIGEVTLSSEIGRCRDRYRMPSSA